jgi:hypothetical protein
MMLAKIESWEQKNSIMLNKSKLMLSIELKIV